MPSNTFATSGRDLVGKRIDNGRLEFISTLGVGAYGVVYLAVDLHAPRPVYLAVKCLLRAGLDSRQRHFQRRETALHQMASKHPNVVTLHKVLEEDDYIFVIMDFCDEGDLFGMITERQRYLGNDLLIKRVFLQIIDAVDYCHRMGIFHRDLKPENILCTQNGERVCIADFGLATSERYSTDFGCGSTFYLSPECQGGLFERLDSYATETNDIWSLGVILVNLTCGRNPWRQACPSDETFRAYVHNPDFLRSILPISRATNRILKGLFALEPRDRTPLHILREQILRVETFTMTDEELKTAHAAARAAAAAVRQPAPEPTPAPAPAPAAVSAAPVPKVKVVPASAQKITVDELDDFATQHERRRELVQIQTQPSSVGTSWSSRSSYPTFSNAQIDRDVFAHIDFSQPTSAIAPAETETPSLIAGMDQDPFTMQTTLSRSSSSGDISLPPTPEFNALDKAGNPHSHAQPIPVPRWELTGATGGNGKGKAQPPRPDLLHINVNPQSPLSGEFVLS